MCSRDGDGNVYAAAEAIQMLSDVAQIPMFSIVSHGMGKGFLGGEIVSQEQMEKGQEKWRCRYWRARIVQGSPL